MNFKRFNGSTWETVQHKIYGSGTDSLTAFPAVIQASGEALTDYTISGNTVQDGTPTPEAPVDVVECGDKTGNLFNPAHHITIENTDYIGDVYLANMYRINNVSNYPCYYKIGENGTTGTVNPPNNVYINARDIVYIWCSVYSNKKICVTEGATIKEYEPYGYKIPVISGGVTTNLYLDEPLGAGDTLTYTDTGIAIPTVDGDNTITFGTTVQPSGMSATFKGWHPVQAAKQYDGSEWR